MSLNTPHPRTYNAQAFGPATTLGYCTNVHPGASLEIIGQQLLKHACGVKDRVSPSSPLPIGLWLPARVAADLNRNEQPRRQLCEFLERSGLTPFTYNAFPYGDFHAGQVKHRVYRPDWSELARLDYTLGLVQLAPHLNPRAKEISLSTLPICWGRADPRAAEGPEDLHACARSLRSLAVEMSRMEEELGVLIHVNLEPEPGCLLHTAADVVWFFETYLLGRSTDAIVRRHIRVCHDVCHGAVMFKDQTEELAAYQRAGIVVGKVQISCALDIDFEEFDAAGRQQIAAKLGGFAEDRYLHQTVVSTGDGEPSFYDDLPIALRECPHRGRWRVHFHVPVFAEECAGLGTTRSQIVPAIAAARSLHDCRHYEVETYAWEVLPPDARVDALADGIAQELHFVAGLKVPLVPGGAK